MHSPLHKSSQTNTTALLFSNLDYLIMLIYDDHKNQTIIDSYWILKPPLVPNITERKIKEKFHIFKNWWTVKPSKLYIRYIKYVNFKLSHKNHFWAEKTCHYHGGKDTPHGVN